MSKSISFSDEQIKILLDLIDYLLDAKTLFKDEIELLEYIKENIGDDD